MVVREEMAKDGSVSEERGAEARGEMVRRLSWAPVRVLLIFTGLFLVRGLIELFVRYCLAFRRRAAVAVKGSRLVLDVEWSIAGRIFRRTTSETPIRDVRAVRLEIRQRYLYLLVGFGALAVGAWIGVQWLTEGLRAGYPYIALIGAAVVAAGALIDIALYLLVPAGAGKRRLLLAIGPWTVRLAGVDEVSAERLLDAVRSAWDSDRSGR